MTDLITRLSKLDAPDREVDARIWCEVNGFRYCDHFPLDRETQVFFKEKGKRTGKVSGDSFPHAPTYTASVDAAIALAERVLPGYSRIMWDHPGECHVDMFKLGELQELPDGRLHKERYNLVQVEQAPTLAIALCIALLRAKEASHAQPR